MLVASRFPSVLHSRYFPASKRNLRHHGRHSVETMYADMLKVYTDDVHGAPNKTDEVEGRSRAQQVVELVLSAAFICSPLSLEQPREEVADGLLVCRLGKARDVDAARRCVYMFVYIAFAFQPIGGDKNAWHRWSKRRRRQRRQRRGQGSGAVQAFVRS